MTDDEIRSLATLVRLQLTDSEVAQMRSDLEGILAHMDALSGVDTKGVEPMTHPLGSAVHLRPDCVGKSLSEQEALAGSPRVEDHCFEVPAILGGGGKTP